jgi:hypothetical protein
MAVRTLNPDPTLPLRDVDGVLARLDRQRREGIWPNGLRYLWTDAFGVVLLVSLWRETGDPRHVEQAEGLVAEVERVLGRPRGLRIGEAPERYGQYYHYLAMWMFALGRLGTVDDRYREKAVALARDVHPAFVLPGRGVVWKMREDLAAPDPQSGLGALDPFHGYVVYRLLDPEGRHLASEIAEMSTLVEASWRSLVITQDLGLGMMLWMSHFVPDEPWARHQRERSLAVLDRMWVDPPGYFCREPGAEAVRFAFTNAGIAVGLEACRVEGDRVRRLLAYFDGYRSGDHYDRDAITHVMGCSARLPGAMLA